MAILRDVICRLLAPKLKFIGAVNRSNTLPVQGWHLTQIKSFFFKIFIYLLLERGEGKEKERERNINVWLQKSKFLHQ